jgi:hypothetical protein
MLLWAAATDWQCTSRMCHAQEWVYPATAPSARGRVRANNGTGSGGGT